MSSLVGSVLGNSLYTLCCAIVAILYTAVAGEAGEIQNGSFENGLTPPVNGYRSIFAGASDIAGWTVLGRIDWCGVPYPARDGLLSAQIVGDGSGLRQSFATIPGSRYKIELSLRPATRVDSSIEFNVALDNASFTSVIPPASEGQWLDFSGILTAASATSVLTITSVNGGHVGPFLDRVQITLQPSFQINELTPNAGPSTGGTVVTFHGSGLKENSEIYFGDAPASVKFVNPTNLIAITPPRQPGYADVRITTSGLETRLTNAFFYFDPASTNPFVLPTAQFVVITLSGAAGEVVSLKRSAGLENRQRWETVQDLVLSNEPVEMVEPPVDEDSHRFYAAFGNVNLVAGLLPGWALQDHAGETLRIESRDESSSNWTFLRNVTVPSDYFTFVDRSGSNHSRVFRAARVWQPKRLIGRLVSKGFWQLTPSTMQGLSVQAIDDLRAHGFELNVMSNRLEFPERVLGGFWVSVGDQMVMSDTNGVFELDDFGTATNGIVLSAKTADKSDPEVVFDPRILIENPNSPPSIPIEFAIDLSTVPVKGTTSGVKALLADPICGDGYDLTACCRDYDGYATLKNPAAYVKWDEDPFSYTFEAKLAAYLGSTCFNLVESGLCAREWNSHRTAPLILLGQAPPMKVTCWGTNHKYRNCQNIDYTFTFSADKDRVLVGDTIQFTVNNNTAANETVIATSHPVDLLYPSGRGPRLSGFFSDYVLHHYDDRFKEHYNSASFTFRPSKVNMPRGSTRLHIFFYVMADGRTLTKSVDVITVDHLKISPSKTTLPISTGIRVEVSAFDDQDALITAPKFLLDYSWVSSRPDIVTVLQDGTLNGRSEGTAEIHCTEIHSGKSMSAVVEVVGLDHLSILPQNATVPVGGNLQLEVKPFDKYDNLFPGTNLRFAWTSSSSRVAEVDSSGRIVAKSEGSTKVTVVEINSGKSSEIPVTVTPQAPRLLTGMFGAIGSTENTGGRWAGQFTIPKFEVSLNPFFFSHENYPFGGDHYNVGNYGSRFGPSGYSAQYTYDGEPFRVETARNISVWINWTPTSPTFSLSFEIGYDWTNSYGTPSAYSGNWFKSYTLTGPVIYDPVTRIFTFELEGVTDTSVTSNYGGNPVTIRLSGRLTGKAP